jgi:hypothetical protein
MQEANETAVITLCGGCGYPTTGPQVCAFCLPMTEQPAA